MPDHSHKITFRHQALKELISTRAIEDQETLVALLQSSYGLKTSQSIISRDIRALGVVKRTLNNRQVYELPQTDASSEIIRLAVIKVVYNESIIVIHTKPGTADFVGDYLDAHEESGILGTISGENTIFVSPVSIKDIQKVYQRICSLLYIKGEINE